MTEKHIIHFDAKGKAMGRIATEVVRVLTGKHTAEYSRMMPPATVFVEIANIGAVKFTEKKFGQKIYYHHTGYIGHLKETTAKNLFVKNPGMLFKKVVRGMLPKNGHRDRLLKKVNFV